MFLLLFVFLLFKIPIFIRLFFLPYRDDHNFYLLLVFDAFNIFAGYVLSCKVYIFMMLLRSAFHCLIFLSSSYCCFIFLIFFSNFFVLNSRSQLLSVDNSAHWSCFVFILFSQFTNSCVWWKWSFHQIIQNCNFTICW